MNRRNGYLVASDRFPWNVGRWRMGLTNSLGDVEIGEVISFVFCARDLASQKEIVILVI